MRKTILLSISIFIAIVFQYCSKSNDTVVAIPVNSPLSGEPQLPGTTLSYVQNYPQHVQIALQQNDNTPAGNAITNDGATLGRVLFYDKQLSKNNTISCSSCHNPSLAFDDDEALSKGFNGGNTTRNSMSLLNVRFYKSGKMFWDERAASLEQQVLQPITNTVEMGLTIAELEAKVKALPYYAPLFTKAFGTSQVDTVKIARALSQFVRSLVSYRSKYDSVKQQLATFTAAEAIGENLFLNAGAPRTCAGCHTPPMFITSTPIAGFGLNDANDRGINDANRFKSGSLRNIATRHNLFHNGSIVTLQDMLTAGAPGSGRPPIPSHSVAPQDVQNLLAFLNTLTDHTIATDEKFLSPFK